MLRIKLPKVHTPWLEEGAPASDDVVPLELPLALAEVILVTSGSGSGLGRGGPMPPSPPPTLLPPGSGARMGSPTTLTSVIISSRVWKTKQPVGCVTSRFAVAVRFSNV